MTFLCTLRSILAWIVYVPFTAVWCLVAIAEAYLFKNLEWEGWIMSAWSRLGLKLFGVKLEIRGFENVPKGSCLFLFNHTSFFDIFAMQAAYGKFNFGAKIELFKIPLFGPAMKRLGVLPIPRSSREKVFRIYEEAQHRAQNGEKFALSPEGQRNAVETLLPFKAGPFIFAINAGMPIVPVVIRGAHEVLPKGHFIPNRDRWRRTIVIQYLPMIHSEGFTIEERGKLQEITYQAMRPFFPATPERTKPSGEPLSTPAI